jgi:signal recognition particle subunit SRP54
MAMMPGIPQEMLQMSDKEGTPKIKKFMCMFDSMTDKELNSDGMLFHSETGRIFRVARGSGSRVREVEEMLSQCKMFAGMIKQIGGPNGMMQNMEKGAKKGGAGSNQNQMAAQMQNSMQQMMPPGMMEQMGGMGGLQGMMEQMGGMGGLGSMFGGGAPTPAVPAAKPPTKKR